jgi:hypothetical protein
MAVENFPACDSIKARASVVTLVWFGIGGVVAGGDFSA